MAHSETVAAWPHAAAHDLQANIAVSLALDRASMADRAVPSSFGLAPRCPCGTCSHEHMSCPSADSADPLEHAHSSGSSLALAQHGR
eukprot:5844849-Lingulodinium_polyedra.AAC.1